MSELNTTRTFRCRPSELWPWITEGDKLKEWLRGTESFRYETPGPPARGSRFTMQIKEGRKLTTYAGELLAVETNRVLKLTMTGGCGPKPMTVEVDYRLTDLGASTQVDYACRMLLPPGFFWRIMGAFGRFFGRLMLKKMFDGLAKRVEPQGG